MGNFQNFRENCICELNKIKILKIFLENKDFENYWIQKCSKMETWKEIIVNFEKSQKNSESFEKNRILKMWIWKFGKKGNETFGKNLFVILVKM